MTSGGRMAPHLETGSQVADFHLAEADVEVVAFTSWEIRYRRRRRRLHQPPLWRSFPLLLLFLFLIPASMMTKIPALQFRRLLPRAIIIINIMAVDAEFCHRFEEAEEEEEEERRCIMKWGRLRCARRRNRPHPKCPFPAPPTLRQPPQLPFIWR